MRESPFAVALEHQEYAFAAGELRGLLDEERLDLGSRMQCVETQTGVCQAPKRLAHVGLDGEMREQPFRWKFPRRAALEPGVEDFSIARDLVEIVSADAFVPQIG